MHCRVLYRNGSSTTWLEWLERALYSEAHLGVAKLLDLSVRRVIDIFSPGGLNYFNGGAVSCLKGTGMLIGLAASGTPRQSAFAHADSWAKALVFLK